MEIEKEFLIGSLLSCNDIEAFNNLVGNIGMDNAVGIMFDEIGHNNLPESILVTHGWEKSKWCIQMKKRGGLESPSHHNEGGVYFIAHPCKVGNVSTNIALPIMHLGACVFAFPEITGKDGGSTKPPVYKYFYSTFEHLGFGQQGGIGVVIHCISTAFPQLKTNIASA
eukprot:1637575-Ditylum_brightwellii.AAC.1